MKFFLYIGFIGHNKTFNRDASYAVSVTEERYQAMKTNPSQYFTGTIAWIGPKFNNINRFIIGKEYSLVNPYYDMIVYGSPGFVKIDEDVFEKF